MRWMLASCVLLCACAKSREPASSAETARPVPEAQPSTALAAGSAGSPPGEPVAATGAPGAVDPKETARAQGQLAVGLPPSAQGAFEPLDLEGNKAPDRNVNSRRGSAGAPPVGGGGDGAGSSDGGARTPAPVVAPRGRVTVGIPSLDRSTQSAAVHTTLVARQAELAACYQKILATNPSFAGRVEVSFIIAPGGTTLSTVSIATRSTSSALDACVIAAIKPATLTAAIDKVAVRGTVSITFEP